MYFDSFDAFLRMGEHGLYVWMAYGATLLVLLSAFFITRSMSRNVEENIRWTFLRRQSAQAAGTAQTQRRGNES